MTGPGGALRRERRQRLTRGSHCLPQGRIFESRVGLGECESLAGCTALRHCRERDTAKGSREQTHNQASERMSRKQILNPPDATFLVCSMKQFSIASREVSLGALPD